MLWGYAGAASLDEAGYIRGSSTQNPEASLPDEAGHRVHERRRDRSRLAVHAGRRKRPVPRRRHGRRLVLRQGARAAARRAAVRRHRARRDSLRLPQLRRRATGRAASTSTPTRRSRTTETPSRSPRRSTRSTPAGSASGGSPTAAVTPSSSAPPTRACAASRRRSPSSTATATCAASTERSASAASSSCCWTTGERASPSGEDGFLPHASPDPAAEVSTWPFPETYETFRELKKSEAPGLREQEHDRVRRAADVLQRRAVPAASARRPDAGDRGREGRSDALGSGDRGLQPDPDREEAARRDRRLDPHDALQRPLAARRGGRRGERLVRQAPAGPCLRARGGRPARRADNHSQVKA